MSFSKKKLKYRLALDVGANSLGWCIYKLNDEDEIIELIRLGSRIFSDGREAKTFASAAAARRTARQARRRRDRVLKRRHRFMQALIEFGLMPAEDSYRKSLEGMDPYELRARGLSEELSLHELGRALYHLARKRGFRSSRKDAINGDSSGRPEDADAQKELGKVNEGIKQLRQKIQAQHAATVGEYFWKEKQAGKSVRARQGKDGQYTLYLQRAMLEEEFRLLWQKQHAYKPNALSDDLRDRLLDIMLFQRRLLPVMPGRCQFEVNHYRAPLCSPLQQRFRILQELNNLRVKDEAAYVMLTLEQRDAMLELLQNSRSEVSFTQLAKAAGFKKAAFNLESEKRKGLKGNSTHAQFSQALGTQWDALSDNAREGLALLISRADQKEELIRALSVLHEDVSLAKTILWPTARSQSVHQHEADFLSALAEIKTPLNSSQIEKLCSITLPEGYGALSLPVLKKLIPELTNSVITYDKAVANAGYGSHSEHYSGEFFLALPYYGQVLRGHTSPIARNNEAQVNDDERKHGRIPNPTVHIGLNQIRRLINALIKRFGHPHQIVIELAREFGASGQRRKEYEDEQTKNQKANESLNNRLRELGQRENRENRLRLKLWDELGQEGALEKQCIYTGQSISATMLFSADVEIDHILPFSKSLHDGTVNKVLCLRHANQFKRNQTPYEAFSSSPQGYSWDDILGRVSRLFAASKNPALRRKAEFFREDALDAYLGDRDFLDRHLNDTAYLSRVTAQYLRYICPEVWATNGRITSHLRNQWGLNKLLSQDGQKNRDDHRHHALDAAVIGACDRATVQRLATAARHAEERGENRRFATLIPPWPSYRENLHAKLINVAVSHKPEHGKEAALHNAYNYAYRGPAKKGSEALLVGKRVQIASLDSVKKLDGVVDTRIKAQLESLIQRAGSPKAIKEALTQFTETTGIRRVMKEEYLSAIPIQDRQGHTYRHVKGDGNYCYDIYRRENGKWAEEVISYFEANTSPDFDSTGKISREGRPLVMRIRKNDMMLLKIGEELKLCRVVLFSTGKVILAGHYESNTDARNRSKEIPFQYIQKSADTLRQAEARLVTVDVLGYVIDRGFKP